MTMSPKARTFWPLLLILVATDCSTKQLVVDNIEPATGKPYSQVADSDTRDVELAVAAAEKAFPEWSQRPAAERSKILLRIADLIERDLEKLVPRKEWIIFPHWLITHGRNICTARKPKCPECVLGDICPSRRIFFPNLQK